MSTFCFVVAEHVELPEVQAVRNIELFSLSQYLKYLKVQVLWNVTHCHCQCNLLCFE